MKNPGKVRARTYGTKSPSLGVGWVDKAQCFWSARRLKPFRPVKTVQTSLRRNEELPSGTFFRNQFSPLPCVAKFFDVITSKPYTCRLIANWRRSDRIVATLGIALCCSICAQSFSTKFGANVFGLGLSFFWKRFFWDLFPMLREQHILKAKNYLDIFLTNTFQKTPGAVNTVRTSYFSRIIPSTAYMDFNASQPLMTGLHLQHNRDAWTGQWVPCLANFSLSAWLGSDLASHSDDSYRSAHCDWLKSEACVVLSLTFLSDAKTCSSMQKLKVSSNSANYANLHRTWSMCRDGSLNRRACLNVICSSILLPFFLVSFSLFYIFFARYTDCVHHCWMCFFFFQTKGNMHGYVFLGYAFSHVFLGTRSRCVR